MENDVIENEEVINSANNLNTIIGEEVQTDAQTNEAQTVSANAEENLYGLLSMVPIGLNFGGYTNTAKVWGSDACRGLASACIPVFKKYSWGQKIINFLETGAGVEEMALAAAAFPLAMATMGAVNQDKAEKQKRLQEDMRGDLVSPDGVHDVGSELGSTFKYADK